VPEVNGQEKTEQATPKKLADSRREGQVARSQELNSLAVFATGLFILFFSKTFIGNRFQELSVYVFGSLGELDLTVQLLRVYFMKAVMFFMLTLAPLLLGLVLISLIAGYGQVGFKITPKALMPKFSKLDPLQGLKNKFFSAQPFVELLKSMFKILIVGWISYIILSDMVMGTFNLLHSTMDEIVNFLLENSIEFLWKIALVYAVIAAADLTYQKFKYKRNLMMTKQEVKEEHKQTEGDPEIKAKIKGKQIEMARNRMMQEVPKADVVITNPTHFAVALKYEVGSYSAPKVVAKGMDMVAQKIKKIAKENNVMLYEDVQLARALYKACDVGDEIPENLYKAVAQILAYVFQLKNNKKSII